MKNDLLVKPALVISVTEKVLIVDQAHVQPYATADAVVFHQVSDPDHKECIQPGINEHRR